MELLLEVDQAPAAEGTTLTVRLTALNDAYEAVTLDRRLLIGPNVVPEQRGGSPMPVSREPGVSKDEQNVIVLNPWCFYGRQRTFDGLPSGRVTVYAYLLEQPTDSLLPDRPALPAIGYKSAQAVTLVLSGNG